MAFDLAGLPLGTVWQKAWARADIETALRKGEKSRKRRSTPRATPRSTPLEQKESVRWGEGLRAAREVAGACPQTTCVCGGDSEADIDELFSEPRSTQQGEVHLLVRACPDRDCEVVFETSEGKSVSWVVKKKTPPSVPPRLNEIIRMIASRGGYVNRKSTEPGPQPLWVGLPRVHDLSTAWETFVPEGSFFRP